MANHKSRLGRGLGALINNAAGEQPPKGAKKTAVSSAQPIAEVIVADASAAAGVYQVLQLDSIQSNPYQPRRDFDESAIADLAKSIESEGLLQPIVVRAKGDQYELIAGERRFRAVQHLGQATIVARVMEVSDASSASLALIENLQREDLNPIDEALGFASLLRDFDLTQEAAAARVGKGRATVANAMRLLTLEPEVQDLLTSALNQFRTCQSVVGLEQSSGANAPSASNCGAGAECAGCRRARAPSQTGSIGYQAEGQPYLTFSSSRAICNQRARKKAGCALGHPGCVETWPEKRSLDD
jgi:ParB family chromosome partitioning protein